eukprot:CAMPEP_0195287324 /NCGR_PEP_ID=MMETSP0707-20130614/4433_1 /TAXON_ID=33640 /ORGANISM="Asterionellopsis glacialis, Strain CCMP134" /LENGTH=453 /DNA_ID=CAMNT_0040347071 /DNA_START=160 /DNA_END=1521 /DNA_ORIENTATION=+
MRTKLFNNVFSFIMLLTCTSIFIWSVNGFAVVHNNYNNKVSWPFRSKLSFTLKNKDFGTRSTRTSLQNGVGIAKDYCWREDALEMDITVTVPANTRAKDIIFKAKQTSIDLRLKVNPDELEDAMKNSTITNNGNTDEIVLLDVNRKMRGRVSLDGTYWVISDKENDRSQREITVTIEKNVIAKDDFDVVDFDWGGVYLNDEDDILSKNYEEPEELNVREYAASLGVDIDNINMSMVDKSMFSSGLNMTQKTMDQMAKAGYIQEVTQQADGTEFVTDEDTGEAVPFSRFGEDTSIGQDEIQNAIKDGDSSDSSRSPKIPFLDTPSPWNKNVPVQDVTIGNETVKAAIVPEHDNSNSPSSVSTTTAAEADAVETTQTSSKTNDVPSSSSPPPSASEEEEIVVDPKNASDPIDLLTVKRLKEILREQGLKVSGNKKELQDRLRIHVQSKLKDNTNE